MVNVPSVARRVAVWSIIFVSVFVASGGFFVPKARAAVTGLQVTSPNGGQHWGATGQNISWTFLSGTQGDLVDIALVDDTLGSSRTVASGVAHELGSYSWNVPTGAPDGLNYKIRIYAAGTSTEYDSSNSVFVVDTTPPDITAPANIALEATAPLTPVTLGTATATDALDTTPVVSNGGAPSSFPVGVNSVTWTATDWAGNVRTATQTVTITDTTAPAIAPHGDESAFSATSAGVAVSYTLPTATDSVDGTVPVMCTPSSGSTFPAGTTLVTCNATDSHLNPATPTTFNVVVTDNVAPTILSYTLNGSAQSVVFNSNTTAPVNVSVTASELVNWPSAKIYLASTPGTYKTKNPAGDGTNIGLFSWDGTLSFGGPGPIDGVYNISVHIIDLAGHDVPVTELAPYTITIDTQAPTLSVVAPVANAVYKSDPPLQFTADGTGTAATCSYAIDGGTSNPVSCTNGVPVSMTISGLSDGRHSIVVAVVDAAGNSFLSPAISFVRDTDNTLRVPSDFTTIQAAVDAATAGDAVLVSGGTYNESVLVTKTLDLAGLGMTKPVITGVAGSNYILKIDGATKGTVANLEINGGGSGTDANAFDYGILVNNSGSGTNPVDIGNVTVKNIWKNGSNGIGIESLSYALVHNSNISSFHKRGIRFINSTGKFFSNEVIGDHVDGTSRVQNLVTLWGGSNVEIYSNTLHDGMSTTPGTWDSPAVFVSSYGGSGASTANIHDNEIYNVDTGIVVGSFYATTDTSSATIINNNLHNLHWAINFEKGTSSATITYNRFSVFNRGVSADDGSGGPTTRPVTNAEKNWWGRVSGPTPSEVYPEVDYSPWCTNEGCTTFGSNSPLDHIDMTLSSPVTLPGSSTITITAQDVSHVTRVNETAHVSLTADGGATFGSTLLSFTNGVATTTVTNASAATINVTATIVGGTQAATGQVVFVGATPTGISVDSVEDLTSIAQTNNTYLDGWHYRFRITVNNTAENKMFVKFAKWQNTAVPTASVSVGGNTKLFINESGSTASIAGLTESDITNGLTPFVSYGLGNNFVDQSPGAANLVGDLSNNAGRQVQFDVFTKLPITTVPGAYSTTYGICANETGNPANCN